MLKRVILIIVGILLIAFIGLQLVPVEGRTNPPVVSEPNWDSPQTRELAKRACFDCHSNETEWPVYAYVAPVSWLVVRDVRVGRSVINFSDWEHVRGEGREPGEMAEVISGGYMPPANYLSMHPTARLTADEKSQLIDGLRATIK